MAIKTNIKVDVQSGKASSDLKKLQKDTSGLSKETKGLTTNLGSMRTAFFAIGGAIAATGMVRATFDAIAYGDSIAKTSDKLGIATGTLQEYRFAAEQTGLTTQALDIGIQRFTRRLGEAAEGAGVLAPVMKELNIQLRDSEGNLRSTEEVLDDYADAIQNAGSSQKQLLLAFKAFDTEGVAFVNTLKKGSDGLSELRQQAVDLGLIMDEELIRKAEIATDKWNILTTQIGVKFKSAILTVLGVLTELRPEIEIVEEELSNLERELKKIERTGTNPWAETFFGGESKPEAIARVTAEIKKLKTTLGDLRSVESKKEELGAGGDNNAAFQSEEEKNAHLLAMGTAFRAAYDEQQLIALQENVDAQAEIEKRAQEGILLSKALIARQVIQQEEDDKERVIAVTKNTLGALSSLTSANSKKIFELGKAASLVSAIVSGASAVVKSYDNAGGYPWGIAPAAAMAAVVATQVQQIRSQQYRPQAHAGVDRFTEDQSIVVKKDEMVLDSGTSQKVRDNVLDATENKNEVTNVINVGGINAIDTESFIDRLGTDRASDKIWNIIMTKMNENTVSFVRS